MMPPFSHSAYVEAFYSADTPMLLYDLNFLVKDINRAGQSFTGYSSDELVGEPVSVIAGDDETAQEIVETLVRGDSWEGDFSLQTKRGRRVHGYGSTAPIVVDGKTKGYVAVFVDTTKQRQYANTSKVLSRLLRHDLRNELNLLYGYLDTAASHTDDPDALDALSKGREQIRRIVARADRVRDLRDLLEQSYDAETRAVDLAALLEERVEAASERFDHADVEIESTSDAQVYADDLLPAVFDALIENAVLHNDKDDPVVRIDVVDRETDVVARVHDNGPGIPPEHEDLIFGREEVDAVHHGSGLGLFFVDSIVTNYDGSVWVEDSDLGGSTFAVRLQHASYSESDRPLPEPVRTE